MFGTHLAKVPDIKQVEGVKELAVAKAKLVMAHLKECPDVLQTQELQKRRTMVYTKLTFLESLECCSADVAAAAGEQQVHIMGDAQ